MKNYKNEEYGFEIKIPDEWSIYEGKGNDHSLGKDHTLIFKCRENEAFSIQITPFKTMPFRYEVELEFQQVAEKKGFTSLEIGRITIEGQEHIWARYYMGGGLWVKKYRVILNGFDYAITATCLEQKELLGMEKMWAEVVASFHLLDSTGKSDKTSLKPVGEFKEMESQALSKSNIDELKTYKNDELGFEIDIPETWTTPTVKNQPPFDKSIVFGCGISEAFNFQIGPLLPDPTLDFTEREFKEFARNNQCTDLELGRITVEGKPHVWARYYMGNGAWTKKYMITLGGIEYAITATCFDIGLLAKKEKTWDEIVGSFRLSQSNKQVIAEIKTYRKNFAGELYAKAYQAVSDERYSEARVLLEQCLRDNPEHVLAHKELAIMLKKMGDLKGALVHRREVKRLDPSDTVNRYNLADALAILGERESAWQEIKELQAMEPDNPRFQNLMNVMPSENANKDYRISSHTPSKGLEFKREIKEEPSEQNTLVFSVISYSLIVAFSFLYILSKMDITVFLSLDSSDAISFSGSGQFIMESALYFGIGAFVCLMFLLGVATIGQSAEDSSILGFIERTMQKGNKQKETYGERIFSDYTRIPNGFSDTLVLQSKSLIHALAKILSIPFSIGLINRGVLIILVLWLFLPKFIFDHPLPILWDAVYIILLYYFCYRAMLFYVAKLKGVSRYADSIQPVELIANPSLTLSIRSTEIKGITPAFIDEILNQENIIYSIKNDLTKTDQVGCKEVWRLGLITSDQDWFDPRPDLESQLERTKRFIKDNNYRYKWVEQFPLKRIATLHWTSYFNTQLNHILISNGKFKHSVYPWWTYPLYTNFNSGEYIRIKNIQIDPNGSFAKNRCPELTGFLREDGFPLKEIYEDGDPLTTERGGVIVIDKDKILVTHPKYFSQRRLIDDEGNLVDIGIDEGFGLAGITEVKVCPAVLNSLVKYANSNGYTPILRYHSFPYTSDFMIPILDTPISTSGWADLFIDPRGNGKLFITKEKTLFEWGEMMEKLRQLFYEALAGKDYHLLGLTKDKAYLNNYLARKMDILKDCYIIQDWQMP